MTKNMFVYERTDISDIELSDHLTTDCLTWNSNIYIDLNMMATVS